MSGPGDDVPRGVGEWAGPGDVVLESSAQTGPASDEVGPAGLGPPGSDPAGSAPTNGGRAARLAVARLLAFLAVGIATAVLLHAVGVLIVVFALILMVMLHELGHFAVAKWSGMKVTEFFFGFGPRLWSVRRGETEYGVKAIPAGGYVRIVGMTTLEQVDPADEARSYRQASFPRRIAVAVAGSTMHLIMAFALLFAGFAFVGLSEPVGTQVAGFEVVTHGHDPAKAAGLQKGDLIISIDGQSVAGYNDLARLIEEHPGQRIALVVRRGARTLTISVVPVAVPGSRAGLTGAAGRRTIGMIGVSTEQATRVITTSPLIAVQRAGAFVGSLTSATALGIGQVFSFSGLHNFAHQVASAGSSAPTGPTGPSTGGSGSNSGGEITSILGVIQVLSQAASRHEIGVVLEILAIVNLFVGMVNLFPMLPLDGGHVVVAIYERIRSRRDNRYHADITKLMPVAYLFLAFIVVLGVSALYLNIRNPVTLPGG